MRQRGNVHQEPHYYSDRLRRKLARLRTVPATILEAPSGYGKTTAIRDFLAEALPPGTPVHWFTAVDELPETSFQRLGREIERIDSCAGRRLLASGLPDAATIGEACEALRSIQCRSETYLVLDNFQPLQPALPPSFFTALLEHGGEGLRIVIMTQIFKGDTLAAIAGRECLRLTRSDLRLDAEDIRRYFDLAGVEISPEETREVERCTEGWTIAVHLQLHTFQETGACAEIPGILDLMDHLVWEKLTDEQQTLLLRLSPFATVTIQQIRDLCGWEEPPAYALDALESPFINRDRAEGRYEFHGILAKLLEKKRGERGATFARECLLRAGDYCQCNGRSQEALDFFWRGKDYGRLLALDLSPLIFEGIGRTPFATVALEIAENCPAEIKKRFPLSMLRIAWALLARGLNAAGERLLDELQAQFETADQADAPYLRGEWLLLSSFLRHPRLDRMTALLRQAVPIFGGRSSRVILPTAPWRYGDHSPLNAFHSIPGEADREAAALEEYLALLGELTNGYGNGGGALYRAELAYQRGQPDRAEILAHQAIFLAEDRRQGIFQLGSALQLAEVALHRADPAGWQRAVDMMKLVPAIGQDYAIRLTRDIVHGILLVELQHHPEMADWLKNGEFPEMLRPTPIFANAFYVHLNYLMHHGEYGRLIGTARAFQAKHAAAQPFLGALLLLVEAAGFVGLGDRPQAAALVKEAAARLLPDRIIAPLVAYAWVLAGLPETLIQAEYPNMLAEYQTIKARFAAGWTRLYRDLAAGGLPADLTPREYEVASLAAAGLRNSEIAAKLQVTENTIRFHLRGIFQKLEIDRRAKLAENLK